MDQGPVRPHINPKFSPKRGAAARVHINPNFKSREETIPDAKVRPGARPAPSASAQVTPPPPPLPQTAPPGAHINPKFAHRPLPSLPTSMMRPEKPARSSRPRPASHYSVDNRSEPIYTSLRRAPSLHLDAARQAEYEASIRRTAASTVARLQPAPPPPKPARPSLIPTEQRLSPSEKENVPSTTTKTKSNIFTPLRNSAAFKKFGSRKLVRVKTPSSTPTTSFKKIGSKKLIRITEKTVPNSSKDKNSPSYQIKTKTKIVKSVKNTPSNRNKYKFSFITPLTNKKTRYLQTSTDKKSNSGGRKRLSSFRSRFKLDRRSKTKPEPQVLFKNTSQTRLKRLSGTTYKVSATKLQKLPPPSTKPGRSKYRLRSVAPGLAASKVITVQGVKFAVADHGRKLKRMPSVREPVPAPRYSASVSVTTTPPGPCLSSSPQEARARTGSTAKVYLGGEELEEVQPGVFTRSRHSLTRQSITEAKNRSINIILKNQNRSKQYCMFFNKFGKCTKKEKGSCPFLHDPEKVAVCRRFLQGACVKDSCLLSHRVAPEKMPTCKFFLEGLCTKEACPYLHTRVSPGADICEAFLKGYCPNGSDCRLRHIMACPEFDRSGLCKLVGRCPFPHVQRNKLPASPSSEKRVAPAKPKRKSLGKTPECSKKSKVVAAVGARYYEEQGPSHEGAVEELEDKRRRLLKKLELAKQGWEGVTVTPGPGEQKAEAKLDDSGPYERIDSGEESGEEAGRPAIGQLGDFISLAGYSSEEEEIAEHRLI